jgi:hypothetical protein
MKQDRETGDKMNKNGGRHLSCWTQVKKKTQPEMIKRRSTYFQWFIDEDVLYKGDGERTQPLRRDNSTKLQAIKNHKECGSHTSERNQRPGNVNIAVRQL